MIFSYKETLQALYGRANAGIKLGLETVAEACRLLELNHLPIKFIVVAGTNGKGSTSSIIARTLQLAGHKVGHYTSPHLLRFTERIRIEGREIAAEQVQQLYVDIQGIESLLPRPLTFFEFATVMALMAFKKAGVDVAVLEVGLGGRLDATNVVNKTLSVITPIAFDHQEFLGVTLQDIAAEKAAIMSQIGTAICAPQEDAAQHVIDVEANRLGTHLIRVVPPKVVAGTIHLQTAPLIRLPLPKNLPGTFQHINIATAFTACTTLHAMGVNCPPEIFAEALSTTYWPGRFHWFSGTPPVILDGAHNPAGMQALLSALEADDRAQDRPIHAIFTALATKDVMPMLSALQKRVTSLHLCPVSSKRSRSLAELQRLAPHAHVWPSAAEALRAASDCAAHDKGVVLGCGSLFLVADLLAELTQEPRDPPIDG